MGEWGTREIGAEQIWENTKRYGKKQQKNKNNSTMLESASNSPALQILLRDSWLFCSFLKQPPVVSFRCVFSLILIKSRNKPTVSSPPLLADFMTWQAFEHSLWIDQRGWYFSVAGQLLWITERDSGCRSDCNFYRTVVNHNNLPNDLIVSADRWSPGALMWGDPEEVLGS